MSLLLSAFVSLWSEQWNIDPVDTATILAFVQGFVLVVQVALAIYIAWVSRKKISAEAKKTSAEARNEEAEYWKGIVIDLRPRIEQLEERDRSRTTELKQMRDAFDFLCETVKPTHEKAVAIARRIAAGKPIGGDDDDITDAH